MLLDADGDVVGEHVVLPLHITLRSRRSVRAIRERFGDDIAPGDAFITNHPYDGGVPHSMDMAVVTPFFAGGRLVAFCGEHRAQERSRRRRPGDRRTAARASSSKKGMQYPPIRYRRAADDRRRDIEAILRANSRTPELVLGDMRGQVGVARLGERRLARDDRALRPRRACSRCSPKCTTSPRRAIRAALAQLARRRARGRSVRRQRRRSTSDARSAITCASRSAATGSTSTSPGPTIKPTARSTSGRRSARGCVYYALIAMIDPTLPNNGGVARVVETRFRHGSIARSDLPGAEQSRTWHRAIAVAEASLDGAQRLRARARGSPATAASAGSVDRREAPRRQRRSCSTSSIGSAYGATRPATTGCPGLRVLLSNAQHRADRDHRERVSDARSPLRADRRFAAAPAGFAAGSRRARVYEMLADDAQLTLRGGRARRSGRRRSPAGGPAALGALHHQSRQRRTNARCRAASAASRCTRGDVVALEKAGGGGLGDPRARPFEAVARRRARRLRQPRRGDRRLRRRSRAARRRARFMGLSDGAKPPPIFGCDHSRAMNTSAFTTTLIEPMGDLTPEVARRLSEAVGTAARRGRNVVITLRSIARLSWAGLCQLADRLHAAGLPHHAVSFSDVVPSVRSLLEAVGLGGGIVDRSCVVPIERICIAV